MPKTSRTDLGELLTDVILETFQLNGALHKYGDALTKPLGLTSARWQVMGAIDLEGHPLTVAQIARRMGLTRQAVQRIVNDLEKTEMLTKELNIDHKRSPLIVLTKKGEQAMETINKEQAQWINDVAGGLTKKQITDALQTLRLFRDRIE